LTTYIRHIVLAILTAGLFGSLAAQDMTLVVPSDLKINSTNYTLKLNDEIQFYYDSMGVKLSLAATKTWTGNDLTYILPQNTATTGENGYKSGEHLYLKIFDKKANCKNIYSAAFTKKNGTGINTFVPGRIDTLTIVNLEEYSFGYAKDTLCSDTAFAQLGGSLIDPFMPFASITSSPSGLNIAANGDISYIGSKSGNYLIRVIYKDYCINGNDRPVTILPQLNLSNANLTIQPNVCGKSNGIIEVKPTGAYEPINYTYSKNGTVISQSTLEVIAGLDDGNYTIDVLDKYACKANTSTTLKCVTPPSDMTLIIPNVFNLKGRPIKDFDLIEIYYDSLGSKLKLVSAQYWQGANLTFSLPANFATVGKNGFNENDQIYLKIFDETGSCRIEVLTLTTNLSDGLFIAGSTQTATAIVGQIARFSYASDTICTGGKDILIEGINDPYIISSLVFKSSPAGLGLSESGSIDYFTSAPGNYIVKVSSNVCVENNGEAPIVVLPQLTLSSQDFTITNNDCGLKNGSIKLNNPLPDPYQLFVKGSQFPIASGFAFDTLSEGIYTIKTKNKYGCAGTSPDLNIVCAPVLDGMLLIVPTLYAIQDFVITTEDSVQLYYDSARVKKKIVASQLYNGTNELRFLLPRNTSLTGKNGFNEGDTLYLKIKDSDKNCFMDNLSLLFQNEFIQFANKTAIISDQVTGTIPSYNYSVPDLCEGISILVAGRGTNSRSVRIKYNYTSTFGLNLDNTTGKVDWTGSLPGSYLVNINTTSCLANYIVPITIHKPISISTDELLITNPDCGQNNGTAELSGTVVNGTPPITYVFSKAGVEILTKTPNLINRIEAGIYNVVVYDRNRCVTGFDFEVKCNQKEEEVTLLTPNHILSSTNPKYAEVKITCDQEITIVNRTGRIVKKLSSNAIWNGTDEHNSELPNGLYIVYCGEKRISEVTILR
jgi:hypothetical protein